MAHTKYESFKDILKQESKALWIFVFYTLFLIILWQFFDLKHWLLNLQNMDWPWYIGPGFALLYIVRGFFYFPSLYFIIAASLLFPFPFSALYYLAGVYGSAALSYQIGHYVRRKQHFPRFLSCVEQNEIKARIKKQGLRAILFFHITGISLDIPNYLAGYLKMPFIKFFIIVVFTNALTAALYFTLFHTGILNIMQWL